MLAGNCVPKLDPNVLFFGNHVDASLRLEDLQRFREEAEGFLERERQHFGDEHPDLRGAHLPLFAETFPPILHSSIIISTVILLEQELRGFSSAVLDSLESRVKFGDLSGSILEKFRIAVIKVADFP